MVEWPTYLILMIKELPTFKYCFITENNIILQRIIKVAR